MSDKTERVNEWKIVGKETDWEDSVSYSFFHRKHGWVASSEEATSFTDEEKENFQLPELPGWDESDGEDFFVKWVSWPMNLELLDAELKKQFFSEYKNVFIEGMGLAIENDASGSYVVCGEKVFFDDFMICTNPYLDGIRGDTAFSCTAIKLHLDAGELVADVFFMF